MSEDSTSKRKSIFVIEVECMIPSIMYLETWAQDENEALNNLEQGKFLREKSPAKQFQARARFQKVKIKNTQNMIVLNKNY
jgi:hypothetical protein